MKRPIQRDTSSSLQRALSLLDAFATGVPEMSIRELSSKSGVARSTTHRLVTELLEWGALERGPNGLRLGVKLLELGSLAPMQHALREASSPALHALSEVSQLTANLAIREGATIVYLDKIASARLRVPHSRFGGRGKLHATALGKAILAHSDEEDIGGVLAGHLASVTVHTITDPIRLREELVRVRREGLAYDREESHENLFCVAAPILDRAGVALAAVSVTGATALSEAERYAPLVLATARSISRRLLQHRADASPISPPGNARR